MVTCCPVSLPPSTCGHLPILPPCPAHTPPGGRCFQSCHSSPPHPSPSRWCSATCSLASRLLSGLRPAPCLRLSPGEPASSHSPSEALGSPGVPNSHLQCRGSVPLHPLPKRDSPLPCDRGLGAALQPEVATPGHKARERTVGLSPGPLGLLRAGPSTDSRVRNVLALPAGQITA